MFILQVYKITLMKIKRDESYKKCQIHARAAPVRFSFFLP